MQKDTKQNLAEEHAERGDMLYKQGNIEAARKEWQLAIQLDPAQLDAHYSLATSFQDEERFDLAEEEFRAILQIAPDESDAHLGLASIADERDDWSTSIREYREVLQITPDDETRRDLIWDLIQHGDLMDARAELEQIEQISVKDDSQLYIMLGEAFEKRNDFVHAIESYKEALEYNPDLGNARKKLKQLAPNGLKDLPSSTLRFVTTRMLLILAILSCLALGALLLTNSALIVAQIDQVASLFIDRRIILQSEQPLSEIDLKASVDTITQRLQMINVPPRGIYISTPNQLIVRLPSGTNVTPVIWEDFSGEQLLEFVDTGYTSLAPGTLIKTRDTVLESGTSSTPSGDIKEYYKIMTQKQFRSVSIQFNSTTQQPYVSFELTDEGRQILSSFTTDHVGRYLTIALNKRVISSPVIRSPITGGRGIIEGQFTLEEAQALAVQMNDKPLPSKFKVVSDDQVLFFMGR